MDPGFTLVAEKVMLVVFAGSVIEDGTVTTFVLSDVSVNVCADPSAASKVNSICWLEP